LCEILSFLHFIYEIPDFLQFLIHIFLCFFFDSAHFVGQHFSWL
jgi:hypothetical protein